MNLGTFSLSLAVKDIAASRAFYEKLTFRVMDGNQDEGWLIMQSGDTKIGLFQGMFDQNLLTFHPSNVRSIQVHLKQQGVALIQEAEAGDGPAHITLADPDGNPILFDQIPADYVPSSSEVGEDA
ncbi:MAG: glyoxalase [Anaerolineaceae bacterium]|nr:glyoxalase [Anaerolineaceae bacterium]